MKKIILLSSAILFFSIAYGQKQTPIITTSPPNEDSIKVFYGLARIKKSEPIDTQKLYFHKFIFFTEQMNKSTGRRSARFEDSVEYYYRKLYKK